MNRALLYILYCIYDLMNLEQRIMTGPIIGKVTETTARILIELENTQEITMILKSDNSPTEVHSKTILVKSHNPTIFSFNELKANTKYFISFLPHINGIKSSFKTLGIERKSFSQMNVAIVSCNDVRYGRESSANLNLWSDLADKAKRGEIDYIFHLGDQVYLDHDAWYGSKDNAYSKVLEYFTVNNITDYEKYTEYAREIIRNDYRMTWGFQPTAEVLSLVPNLMMMDDHEIHNDLVLDDSFNDPNSFNYFWKNQARFVLYQYQRQLRIDVDFENYLDINIEYFEEKINGFQFIFLDLRGFKAWGSSGRIENNKSELSEKEEEDFYLGEEQNYWLKNIFNDTYSTTFNTAVIVSSIPLAIFSKEFTRYIATNSRDFEEFWSYNHENDEINLLNFLYNWKKSDKTREILLIGGDTHFGIMTDIYYNKEPFLKQLTTSPISQMIMPLSYVIAINSALDIRYSLKEDFCFSHYDYVTDNNYGIVQIRQNQNEKSFIEYFLMSSDGKAIKQNKSDYNFSFRDFNLISCCGSDCRIDYLQQYMKNVQKNMPLM